MTKSIEKWIETRFSKWRILKIFHIYLEKPLQIFICGDETQRSQSRMIVDTVSNILTWRFPVPKIMHNHSAYIMILIPVLGCMYFRDHSLVYGQLNVSKLHIAYFSFQIILLPPNITSKQQIFISSPPCLLLRSISFWITLWFQRSLPLSDSSISISDFYLCQLKLCIALHMYLQSVLEMNFTVFYFYKLFGSSLGIF